MFVCVCVSWFANVGVGILFSRMRQLPVAREYPSNSTAMDGPARKKARMDPTSQTAPTNELESSHNTIVLRFVDKETITTTRDELCALSNTWFQQAFGGRNEGMVVQNEDEGTCSVVGSASDPRFAKLVVQYLVAVHSQQATVDLLLNELDLWTLLNEAVHFQVAELSRAVAVQ